MQQAALSVARKPARRGLLVGALVAAVGCVAFAALLLRFEPSFLAAASSPEGAAAERAAARMVTTASALYAGMQRPGSWDGVVADSELNAWLATDLPRNHGRLQPRGLFGPRVRFRPQRVAAGAWLGWGMFSGFGWIDLEIRLRGANQLGIVLHDARLGRIPLPHGPVLRQIASRLTAAGLATDLRRLDDELILVVSIPSSFGSPTGRLRLDWLQLDDGELLLAGSTTD